MPPSAPLLLTVTLSCLPSPPAAAVPLSTRGSHAPHQHPNCHSYVAGRSFSAAVIHSLRAAYLNLAPLRSSLLALYDGACLHCAANPWSRPRRPRATGPHGQPHSLCVALPRLPSPLTPLPPSSSPRLCASLLWHSRRPLQPSPVPSPSLAAISPLPPSSVAPPPPHRLTSTPPTPPPTTTKTSTVTQHPPTPSPSPIPPPPPSPSSSPPSPISPPPPPPLIPSPLLTPTTPPLTSASPSPTSPSSPSSGAAATARCSSASTTPPTACTP